MLLSVLLDTPSVRPTDSPSICRMGNLVKINGTVQFWRCPYVLNVLYVLDVSNMPKEVSLAFLNFMMEFNKAIYSA